jgi:hypothetical protein
MKKAWQNVVCARARLCVRARACVCVCVCVILILIKMIREFGCCYMQKDRQLDGRDRTNKHFLNIFLKLV